MRVAILLHPITSGGASRFQRLLIRAMAEEAPTYKFDVYTSDYLNDRDRLPEDLDLPNIRLRRLEEFTSLPNPTLTIANARRDSVVKTTLKRIKPLVRLVRLAKQLAPSPLRRWLHFTPPPRLVAALAEADVLYLPFPYLIAPFATPIPVVGTFHDFNYAHDFEGNFPKDLIRVLEHEVPRWLNTVHTAVCSTHFISNELLSLYPRSVCRRAVIYLSTFRSTDASCEEARQDTHKNGLSNYIIYPCRIARHKNVETLIRAMAWVAPRLKDVTLVLTGHASEQVYDRPSEHQPGSVMYEVTRAVQDSGLEPGRNLLGLGYVSDREIDSLVCGASVVVSTSLYEAGCGPALDAWSAGVPVAFSDIPPFREQCAFLGTHARLFDPRSPQSVAEAILDIYENRDEWREKALQSQDAIRRYGWDQVARQYLTVLESAAESTSHPSRKKSPQ